ncbi:MAG: tetratricopeptide repeat protein [Haliscomenobacter sp.]|nr:tetratricopeptide repeat protein [Haliscomenobacter sp.]MBK8654413.1 tetratricopeptide repeat protein [Haliscomenobacter sp.]MBP9078179.1 tetratricopeptide repeat protein [Haliscomenobacter sp.]MBP9873157.1 tetratricopeptide repeat protein [Haliscomenobacter sp.]
MFSTLRSAVVLIWAGLMLAALFTACSSKENPGETQVVASGDPVLDQLSLEISRNPKQPDLFFKRAERYYENGGFDEAIRDLQSALQLDSVNVQYLHLLADVYLDYFRSREALKTMEKAVALYPERIPSLLKLSEFQLILKQYEASRNTISRVLKLDPLNADGFFMIGMNLKETGDTLGALDAFQSAVENDPELIDAWINLGQLYAARKDPVAIRYFDSALRVDPRSAQALHAKAFYLQERNMLPEALKLFQEMALVDPQNADAHYNSGLLYLDMDSIPQAYQAFNLAIQTDPVHIRAYFYRGISAEMQGKKEQARADYAQALRLAPDYQDARSALEALGGKQ